MNLPTIHLVLLVAATWRLSNLLANEDGPFHVFKTLRAKIARAEARSRLNEKKGLKGRKVLLSKLHLYEGVNCEYCNSIWFGTLLTILYAALNPIDLTTTILLPLALSTGAILIKRTVFLLTSIDARFDQQNQQYLKQIEEWERFQRPGSPAVYGTPEGDASVFTQNLAERR